MWLLRRGEGDQKASEAGRLLTPPETRWKKWDPALNGTSIFHAGQLQAIGALAGEVRLCALLVVAEEACHGAEKSISHLSEP